MKLLSFGFLLIILVLLGWSPALAQGQLWIVDDDGGPGVDFTVLQDAVDAAADGDVVLVRSGVYGPPDGPTSAVLAVGGKGLVVTADRGEHVVVSPNGGFLPAFHVSNLGPDDAVVLRGIEFVGGSTPLNLAMVDSSQGSVRLEDCRLRGAEPSFFQNQWGLQVTDCADLTLVRTRIEGRGRGVPAVLLTNTQAHFFETEVRGGDGEDSIYLKNYGGGAVSLEGGSLVASGGSFRGGDGGDPMGTSCATGTGGNGGYGLNVVSGQVLLSSVTLAGGAATKASAAGCPDGTPGAALVDPTGAVTVAQEPSRGVHSASPAPAGNDAVLALTGRPGEEAFVLVASTPDALLVPSAGGALLVGALTAVLAAGPVQAWGSTTLEVQVPPLPLGLEATTWHVQAAFLDPVLGARLGGVTALTVLAPLP